MLLSPDCDGCLVVLMAFIRIWVWNVVFNSLLCEFGVAAATVGERTSWYCGKVRDVAGCSRCCPAICVCWSVGTVVGMGWEIVRLAMASVVALRDRSRSTSSVRRLIEMLDTPSVNFSQVEMSFGRRVRIERGRLLRAIDMSMPLSSSMSSAMARTLCAQSM